MNVALPTLKLRYPLQIRLCLKALFVHSLGVGDSFSWLHLQCTRSVCLYLPRQRPLAKVFDAAWLI